MKHLVLVHDACHGGWSWYKIVNLLSSAGYRVTTLDLCGNLESHEEDEIVSISDYLQPLMEFMSSFLQEERVILVGHGYGGVGVSLAMEKFPEKISVAVFVAAVMPSCRSPLIDVFEEFFTRAPVETLLDCEFSFDLGRENLPTSVILGPDFLLYEMYNCCPFEVIWILKWLPYWLSPLALFFKDLTNEKVLSKEKFGSVNRVYIKCDHFQRWMIDNSPTKDVKVIEGAHHMVMISKPNELYECLKDIAGK
ncbi:methylesterase 10-like [Telopea speciosissima]|uniref:methylesterase 10-like n=1 Tax=Telopea speciosissima TaxID=54955 RepID=UPI001CC77749|nr:methylesterase 10-like [Telopea speciosissima]